MHLSGIVLGCFSDLLAMSPSPILHPVFRAELSAEDAKQGVETTPKVYPLHDPPGLVCTNSWDIDRLREAVQKKAEQNSPNLLSVRFMWNYEGPPETGPKVSQPLSLYPDWEETTKSHKIQNSRNLEPWVPIRIDRKWSKSFPWRRMVTRHCKRNWLYHALKYKHTHKT